MGTQAVLDTALLPSVAVGAGISADLLWRGAVRAGVGGELLAPQRTTLDAAAGGYFSAWAVDIRACWQTRLAIALAACPSLWFGNLHGSGRGVAPSLGQDSRLVAPGFQLLGLPVVARHFELLLSAAGLFPLSRDVFVIAAGPVHAVPPFSLELRAGGTFRAL